MPCSKYCSQVKRKYILTHLKNKFESFLNIITLIFYLRDLKPENLLLESKKEGSPIKVIDFGTSRQFNSAIKMNQKFGTILYMAPEVLKGKYDQKCDIWSCGVICYILLCGYPPFNDRIDTVIIEKIKKADLVFPPEEWNQVSLEAKDFVRKLLNPDPDSRLSASEALKHPWILKRRRTESLSNPNSLKALNNLKTFRADRKIQQGHFRKFINNFFLVEIFLNFFSFINKLKK